MKVSILIPAYNQPLLVKHALDSIVCQTFKDFEVVITDDSTNNLVKDVASKYPDMNIRYYKNPIRLGTPGNWNESISRASGDYIKFLHHDDWFATENSLNQFVAALDYHSTANFAFSRSITCNTDGTRLCYHSATEQQLQSLRESNTAIFPDNFIGAPSSTIYRRSVNLLFDIRLKWLVDIDFYIRVLKQNPHFIFIPDDIMCCSIGSHSVTHECKNDIRTRMFEWAFVYSRIIRGKY
jgi:glycosyltransferase involved in cell wall biosynthesis